MEDMSGLGSADAPAEERRRVVVIGAGQAGLSAAHFLRRAGLVPGVDLEVLDANPTPGGAWSHRWDELTFDDAHGIHDLPGSRLGATDPTEPAREVVKRYYGSYEREQGLMVSRPWRVVSVERTADAEPARRGSRPRFRVTAMREGGSQASGAREPGHAVVRRVFLADSVISGTGTWDRPYVPHYPGRF